MMQSMIERLREQAMKSNMSIKLASGLFYSKKGFVSVACNSTRTYINKKIKPNFHAEEAVLYNFQTRFTRIKTKNLKLIVVRISPGNNLLFSKPCITCTHAIQSFGIRKIYYINEHNQLICERIESLCKYHEQFPYISRTNLWFKDIHIPPAIITKHLKENTLKTFTKEMGTRISLLRIERNWTQRDLAIRLCIHIDILDQIERGRYAYNLFIVDKLRNYFGFIC